MPRGMFSLSQNKALWCLFLFLFLLLFVVTMDNHESYVFVVLSVTILLMNDLITV